MADLGMTFTTDELPKSEYTLIPDGTYPAVITNAEVKDTSSGTGKYIKVEYTIQGANYSGKKVWGNLNIRNANPKAQEIGLQQLGELLIAVNLKALKNTDELLNKQLQIKIKTSKPQAGYDPQNEVRGFKSLTGGALPMPSAPSAPPQNSNVPF